MASAQHDLDSLHPSERTQKLKDPVRTVRRMAYTAASLVAAATVAVPFVTASETEPGCIVIARDGDTGYELADQTGTPRHLITEWNPKISNEYIQPGDKIKTVTCGDLGDDHTVIPLGE